ncbi:2-hydroxyacid dehydrogenase [Mesonia aestuariivivens]|uniref:2-hydroxyacid dehydrogenase n=1 Tax=Mesonia aestuariivivens TaxID=2796128 RepID=A0ABS6W5X3_9FLAO|nr:2-hydroxyacid dehydrogenase [Mesonia aestuariivivens]MBW2962534.1 2-hydroxyacid dehydrogenase [Mesonia aestuariivivens]
MKIAFFSTKSYDKDFFEPYNHQQEVSFKYFNASLTKDTAALARGYDGICVFVNDHLDEETLQHLKEIGVRLVVLRCAGFNNVNLKAAEQLDIKVYRVPAYSPQAVAEHALALILTLNRKTHKAYNRVRDGNFSLDRLQGFNLQNKTIGVIGTGRIGASFCKIMKGFTDSILAFDKYENEKVSDMGVKYVDLDVLLEKSDIISLHCPLTPETKYLIDAASLRGIKKGCMLINTSRGALIHTGDAIEALKEGKLGYLGIDVYEQEEHLFFRDLSENIIQDDHIARLISFPNVLITAHQGFLTKEALQEIAKVTFQNILDFQEGKESENRVLK